MPIPPFHTRYAARGDATPAFQARKELDNPYLKGDVIMDDDDDGPDGFRQDGA